MPTIKKIKGEGFRVEGIDKVIAALKAADADVKKASEEAIWEAGNFLERKLKRKLSQPGSGKTYISSMKGKRGLFKGDTKEKRSRYSFHVASVPGQPPAPDLERLKVSITHNTTYRQGAPSDGRPLPRPGGIFHKIKGYIGTNVAYGYFLEVGAKIWPYGNKNIGKRQLLPRPWFMVTLGENQNNVVKLMIKSLKRTFKSHTGTRFK